MFYIITTGTRREGGCGSGSSGGRRRGETRLRESQSLNRITEVQEVEANNSPTQKEPQNESTQPPPSKPQGNLNCFFVGSK